MSQFERKMLLGMVALVKILQIIARIIPTDNPGRELARGAASVAKEYDILVNDLLKAAEQDSEQ